MTALAERAPSPWAIRVGIRACQDVEPIFGMMSGSSLIQRAVRVHNQWEDRVETTAGHKQGRTEITASLAVHGMEAIRICRPTETWRKIADDGLIVRALPDPSGEPGRTVIERKISRACRVCGEEAEWIYVPEKELSGAGSTREMNPINVRISGMLCTECRLHVLGRGKEDHMRRPEHEIGQGRADLPHRCATCHVGFDVPQKLAAHKTNRTHKFLMKLEYYWKIGYVIVRGREARAFARVLDLTEHPAPQGIMLSALGQFTPGADGDTLYAAVPLNVWDCVVGAMTMVIHRENLSAADLIPPRKQTVRTKGRFPTWGANTSYDRARMFHKAHEALAIAVTVKETIPQATITWPKLAWGMGEVIVAGPRQGDPNWEWEEKRKEGVALKHQIESIRRVVGTFLGPHYMRIVHEIWGSAPPDQMAKAAARLSQVRE